MKIIGSNQKSKIKQVANKGQRKRADADFSKIIVFVKKLPSLFSSTLTTGKFYRTSYKTSKIKVIKQFWDPFKGFLNFMMPIDEFELKFKLFLEFICIDSPKVKVNLLLKDLLNQNSISERLYKRLKLFLDQRRKITIDGTRNLFKQNHSLRLCLYIIIRVLNVLKRPRKIIDFMIEKLSKILSELNIEEDWEFLD